MSERLDRATARRIAEALMLSVHPEEWRAARNVGTCRQSDFGLDQRLRIVDIILFHSGPALTPAKPPGRTKRGKKGRAK